MNLPNEPYLSIAEISFFPVRESGNLSTSVVYRTVRRGVQAAQQMQQGGFPCPGFANQRQHFAGIDIQI